MSKAPAATPRPRSLLRRLARGVRFLVLSLVIVAAAIAVGAVPWYVRIRGQAIELAKVHQAYEVAHPGWSFPSRIWSDSAPIDTSPVRIAQHAEARGYSEACPPKNPGEYCKKTGEVVLRGGRFPEGIQPPGNQGWTRPLAFEPVLLTTLIGVDGERREHLPLADAPPHLTAAIMAAEDEHFRDHYGVDFFGMARAAFSTARGNSQGGSTLTMQLVRNLTQDRDRTLARKVREMALATAFDRYVGKDGVLQMYLDAPYLGQDGTLSVCGFQAASQYYWGIDAKDLSLAQAATLASILPAPGRFSPDRNPDQAKARRDRLLKRMGELGWDVEAALDEPINASPHPLPPERYPAYVQATRSQLEADLPLPIVYGAGLDVYTGLDLAVQNATDKLFPERIKHLERAVGRRGKQPLLAAGSIIDPRTGALIAVVDTSLSTSADFNRATQARRQAGSSFKPLVYALGFMPGADGKPLHLASDTVPNSPRDFAGTNGWRPRNVGGRYSQTVSLASGLAMSQNIATASLLEELGGPEPLIEFASHIGIDTSAIPAEMGIALGQGQVTTLEMARFVAAIARSGTQASGKPVRQAIDPRGEVRWQPTEDPQAMPPETAALTRELMGLVVSAGTGGSVRGGGGFPGYDGPLFGKTGTTDLERDLWFIGSTPTYSAALWLGYDQPTPIGASASDLAAPFFGWWMRAVHEGLPRETFSETPKIEKKLICSISGKSPGSGCHLISAPFLEGTGPTGYCGIVHPPPDPNAPEDEHKSLWERIAEQNAADTDTDFEPIAPDTGDLDTDLTE